MTDREEKEEKEQNEKSERSEIEQPRERHVGFYVLVALILLFIPVGMKFYSSYLNKRLDYMEKVAEEKKFKAEIDKIKADVEKKKEREKYLKTNQGVEEIARNKLGLTKPEEIPFIVSPGKGSDLQESPAPPRNKQKPEMQKPEKEKKPKAKNIVKPNKTD